MNEDHTMNASDSSESKPFNPMMIVGGIAVLGVVALVVASTVGKNPDQPTPANDVMVEEDAMMESGTEVAPSETGETMMDSVDAEGVRTIQVEAGAFYYKPDEIRVKKGETVRIVMNSVDMMHDFNIDELNVQLPITKSGETGTVEFTADTVGEFEYYCSVGEHKAQGQIGTLIVEE